MFRRIGNGFRIVFKSIGFAFKKPLCLVPFFLAFILNVAFLITLNLNINIDNLSNGEALLYAFLVIFVTTVIVSIASLILLELLEQYETDGTMSLGKAFGDALSKDLFRTLPIIIGWSIIQFILMLLDSLLSGDNNGRRSSVDRAISRAISAINRGVRMGAMIIMASIAWEDIKTGDAYRKGKDVYKKYFVEVATAVAISPVVTLLLIIPLIILVLALSYGNVALGPWFMYVVIFYFAFIWSMGLLVEQMFAAELYLWYKCYEDEKENAVRSGLEPPVSIRAVKKPSFFDDVPDMVLDRRNKKDTQLDY